MDAASARPEACRDKSKGPRSGDVAGRSPGVQGAVATGRPLCAPGTMSDIAQKNISPGGGWRLTRPTGASHRLTPRRPGKRSATGRCHQARSRFIAGWRLRLTRPTRPAPTVCRPGKQLRRRAMASGTELRLCRVAAGALPGLQGLSGLGRLNPQACRKIYPLRYSSRQLSTGQPYPAPAACSCGQGLTSRTRSACRHSGRSLMESV